eukprot:8953942-Ditylum_brightwellii.AAC.1
MQDILYNASSCADINNYVRTKTGWLMELMTHVQWDAIDKAFDKITPYNKIRILKFQHNWLPTTAHLHDIYPLDSPKCLLQINRNFDGITLLRVACPNTGLLCKQSTYKPSIQT